MQNHGEDTFAAPSMKTGNEQGHRSIDNTNLLKTLFDSARKQRQLFRSRVFEYSWYIFNKI